MPRPRPRTSLHILADAITSLDKASTCLQEVDLRTAVIVREDIKQARERASEAIEATRQAYLRAAGALTP